MAAAARQGFGDFLLGMAKALHQLPIRLGLFNCIQLGALDVFNNRYLKHFSIAELPNDHRQFVQISYLRSAPTPFTCDDFILGRNADLPNDQGLNNALLGKGGGKVLQCLGIKITSRLVGVRENLLDWDQIVDPALAFGWLVALDHINVGHQCGKPAPQSAPL